jgi:hypothetical protein
MNEISTKLGLMNESELDYKEGTDENDNEIVKWQEWKYQGELVKRNVHVHLKEGFLSEATATF